MIAWIHSVSKIGCQVCHIEEIHDVPLSCCHRHFTDKENMPRKRNSGSDALQFLHQKMELEREMRKEELAMRRAEVKRDEAERDRRFELFQQQQQQTQQQFMQQQQQMQQHLAQQQQQMQNMLMMFMQSMKGNNKQ